MSTFEFENNMNFANYNNVFCEIYSIENEIHTFCIDIDSKSSLISKFYFEKCYSNLFTYFMFDNKRLRCNDIKIEFIIFNRYVNIFFRFRDYNENYIIKQNEMYIISKLFCDMIVNVTILKFNNMIIHWNSNNFFVVNNHKISIIIITNHISKIKIKTISIAIFIIKSNVIFFIQKRIKKNT